MEYLKNKFKIEYRADLINKVVKDNNMYLCEAIQEQVRGYKKTDIFEVNEEFKNPITEKKLVLNYEHFKENKDIIDKQINTFKSPEKVKVDALKKLPKIIKFLSSRKINRNILNWNDKLNGNNKINDCYIGLNNNPDSDYVESKEKKFEIFDYYSKGNSNQKNTFNKDEAVIVKNFKQHGSTTFFKFNLNSKNSILKQNKSEMQVKEKPNEYYLNVKKNSQKILFLKDNAEKDKEKKKSKELNIDSINKKISFGKRNSEAYGSYVNHLNPSDCIFEIFTVMDNKLEENPKNKTTMNINILKANLSRTLKNSILSKEILKSTFLDNTPNQKLHDFEKNEFGYTNQNYYPINSYSANHNKKNFRRIKNMIYKKENEFYLSSSIRNSKEVSAKKVY